MPGTLERRKILEEAGLVLAEARWLRDCLDRTGGKLDPEDLLPLKTGAHFFIGAFGESAKLSRIPPKEHITAE